MKRLKKILLLIAFALVWQPAAFAQSEKQAEVAGNTVYLELLGNAYLYSLNYERSFIVSPKLSVSGRVGICYFNLDVQAGGLGADFDFWFFPVTLNVIRHFNRNNLELGLGTVNELYNDSYRLHSVPTFHAAYRRYMKNNFDFRAGINLSRAETDTDYDKSYEIFPWPVLSIGKRF